MSVTLDVKRTAMGAVRVLFAFAALVAAGRTDQPSDVHARSDGLPEDDARGGVRLGDVLMRSLRAWPKDAGDTRDTLATAKAFRVDRILWIYENTPEYNARVRAEGLGIGTTMAGNAREMWHRNLPRDESRKLVDRFTIRNLDGEQVLPEHMQRFGRDAWISHFQPDQTDPEWAVYYVDYVAKLYETGIDAIHRDDAAICTSAPRSGGSFTDSAVAWFRQYLQGNCTPEQLAALGVNDGATFNVRDYFKARGAPSDTSLWAWRGSPLMSVYLDAMKQADREFFLGIRAEVERRTGRRIPWSLNATGPKRPLEDAFDFRIGEFQSHHNQPQTMLAMAGQARRAGKPQALVSMVDRNWEELAAFVPDLRRHIATAYAAGMIPLVPWCMYMHDAPRYYGKPEDFADLFHFVSAHRDRFDGHALVSASGVDALARLYSWSPNKELIFDAGDAAARVWMNRPNLFAFVRKPPGANAATIHLVDWNPDPAPFDITFSPFRLVGARAAKLTFLRPGQPPCVIPAYLGETLEVPGATPWTMVAVEPAGDAGGGPAAPGIASPTRAVVPTRSAVRFAPAEPGTHILARIIPDGASEPVPFTRPAAAAGVMVQQSGIVEAVAVDDKTGAKSGTIRVRFEAYRDLGAPDPGPVAARPGVDLAARFAAVKGAMKVNASFLAPEMRLMGDRVEKGVSTRGDATLTCDLDPAWRFFTVRVGVDDAEDRRPCVRFQVLFDTRLAFETPIVNPAKSHLADEERRVFPLALRIPTDAKTLQLRAVNGGFFRDQNTVIWAEPTASR